MYQGECKRASERASDTVEKRGGWQDTNSQLRAEQKEPNNKPAGYMHRWFDGRGASRMMVRAEEACCPG